MTFEELKEKAKELGAIVSDSVYATWWIIYKGVKFQWNGEVLVKYSYYDTGYLEDFEDEKSIASDRTIDQMWKIMEALQ